MSQGRLKEEEIIALLSGIENVRLNGDESTVVIVDQTALPGKKEFLELGDAKALYDAIFELKVRGAPAIGICASYGIFILAKQIQADSGEAFYKKFKENVAYLNSSRPTAVNLSWALHRMEELVKENISKTPKEIVSLLREESRKIQAEDAAMCKAISEYGLSLLKDGDGILTHCNAGPLATSKYGTALGPLFLERKQG